jgi:hypothetical protein
VDSEDWIRKWNRSLGRNSIGSAHEVRQTFGTPMFNENSVKRQMYLVENGREDLLAKFVDSLNYVYQRYKQVPWQTPLFSLYGKMPWLVNMDSLECIQGNKLNDFIHS